MKRFRRIATILGIFLTQATFGQQDANMLSLEPAYIHDFNQHSSWEDLAIKNVLQSPEGRLWLDPGFNHNLLHSLHIVGLEGYDFSPITMDTVPFLISHLTDLSPNGQIVGFNATNLVFQFDPSSHQVKKFDLTPWLLSNGKIKNVIATDKGSLIALGADDEYLYLFEIYQEEIKVLVKVPNPTEGNRHRTIPYTKFPLIADEEGYWFMNNYLPLFHYNRSSQQLQKFVPEKDPIRSPKQAGTYHTRIKLAQHPTGFRMILPAYEQMLWQFSFTEKTIRPFNHYPNLKVPHFVANDAQGNLVTVFEDVEGQSKAILEDTQGRLWDYSAILTDVVIRRIKSLESQNFFNKLLFLDERGLKSMQIRKGQAVKHFPEQPPNLRILNGILPNGGIFAYTSKGDFYEFQGDQVRQLTRDSVEFDCLLENLALTRKRRILQSPNGDFWGIKRSKPATLFHYNAEQNTCRSFPIKTGIDLLAYYNDSTLVRLGLDGLFFIDTESGVSRSVLEHYQYPLNNEYLNELKIDYRHNAWISNSYGLFTVNLKTKEVKKYGEAEGFRFTDIQRILESSQGLLYLGSASKGLYIFDPKTNNIQVRNTENGLVNNQVSQILEDDKGYIWVATRGGLSLLSPEGHQVVKNLTEEDGLPSNKIYLYNGYKDKRKNLWFGTNKGIIRISSEELQAQINRDAIAAVFLTELTCYDPNTQQESTRKIYSSLDEEIKLPATHRFLRLKFALPNWVNPKANRFAYLLEGIDRDWKHIGNQQELILNQLPAGRYRLLIKGQDYQNNSTIEPLVINIHAQDFFYKQVWFYLLIVLSILALTLNRIWRLRSERNRLEKEVSKRTTQIEQDKKQIEQQAQELQRANKLQGRFFANISHELRTPITLIGTPVEQIIEKHAEILSPNMIRSLELVRNNTRKLNSLVAEILELSKLESGTVQLKKVPVPILAFVRQLFATFESQAHFKKITYSMQADAVVGLHLLLDRSRFAKIINNLLSNALKFTPVNGEVQLTLRIKRDPDAIKTHDLYLSVRDTGRGIAESDLPHVFDRYFQTRQTDLPREGGTGIGLALSKELALLMKGDLSVESKLETGSTFSLSLPGVLEANNPSVIDLDLPVPQAPIQATSRTKVGQPKQLPQILIVEDNADMQQLLLSILSENYHCHLANNGWEAWSFFQQQNAIRLIISDVMMPELDGYGLLEKIRNSEQFQFIPVILLTALTAEKNKLRALRLGVDDYLNKPFSPTELLVRSANLLQRSTIRANAQTANVEEDTPLTAQQIWLQQIDALVLDGIQKKLDLNIAYLAHQMNLGERQLLRRLKSHTGLTTNQYILEVKLQEARRLLEQQTLLTVAEVAYASGFKTPAYFSKNYLKRFGKRPLEYFETLG